MTQHGMGLDDLPTASPRDDQLGLDRRAKGLARFALSCTTPMTVGIQGPWGSGKTSLLNLLESHTRNEPGFEQRLFVYRFETWRHGLVHGQEGLGFTLLADLNRHLASRFSAERPEAGRYAAKIARGLRVLMRSTAAGMITTATSGLLDGGVVLDGGAPTHAPDPPSPDELREQFHRLVEAITGSEGRLLFIVDDLDRIRPSRAVELLEVLKCLMDSPRCVFIVACDREVVREGVAERLGMESVQKADDFFDKIFQLPFQMPVASYDFSTMVEGYLRSRLTGRHPDPEEAASTAWEEVPDALVNGILTTPRALKRVLNVIELVTSLSGTDFWDREEGLSHLLVAVLLQRMWPEVVAWLADCEDTADLAACLTSLEADEADEDFARYTGQAPRRWSSLRDGDRLVRVVRELAELEWKATKRWRPAQLELFRRALADVTSFGAGPV